MRPSALAPAACLLVCASALAQSAAQVPEPGATDRTPDLAQAADAQAWSFSVSAYTYFLPDEDDFVQPTFTADHDWLHLEARYNYEALDTASAWVGYNLSFGEDITLELTPMVGGVFGDTEGVALGYKGTLAWRVFELYTEGEYVIDAHSSADNFFYTWSELTCSPVEWFRFGLVVQRTKLYENDFDIQRGFLIGFSYKSASVTAYVLNPDENEPTVVLGVGLDF